MFLKNLFFIYIYLFVYVFRVTKIMETFQYIITPVSGKSGKFQEGL